MRKGPNPAKFVKGVAEPQPITGALLNHIPFLSGFYTETLDVLKVSLEFMCNNVELSFNRMVFGNSSYINITRQVSFAHEIIHKCVEKFGVKGFASDQLIFYEGRNS